MSPTAHVFVSKLSKGQAERSAPRVPVTTPGGLSRENLHVPGEKAVKMMNIA